MKVFCSCSGKAVENYLPILQGMYAVHLYDQETLTATLGSMPKRHAHSKCARRISHMHFIIFCISYLLIVIKNCQKRRKKLLQILLGGSKFVLDFVGRHIFQISQTLVVRVFNVQILLNVNKILLNENNILLNKNKILSNVSSTCLPPFLQVHGLSSEERKPYLKQAPVSSWQPRIERSPHITMSYINVEKPGQKRVKQRGHSPPAKRPRTAARTTSLATKSCPEFNFRHKFSLLVVLHKAGKHILSNKF